MANPSPPPTPEPSSPQRRSLKRVVIGGGLVVVLGTLGYRVTTAWLRSQLPGFVEAQITPILNRPLELGSVQQLSLTGVDLDGLYLPPTADNANSLRVDQIRVQYNLLALMSGQLPITITLRGPRLIAQQAEDGQWLTLDLNLPEPSDEDLPIEIPLNLIIEGGNLELTAQGRSPVPFELGFQGDASLTQAFEQAQYDLAITLPEGAVDVQGTTRLSTLETRLNPRLQQVALPQFLALLPPEVGDRIPLTSGSVNGNLNLEIPPLLNEVGRFNWVTPQIRGTLSLNQLAANLEGLNQPLTAEVNLRFQGRRLQLDRLTAQTGNLQLNGSGSISESAGYNLAFSVPEIALERLSDLIDDSLLAPLNTLGLTGVVQGQAQLLGDLTDPQLTLNLSNSTPLIVAQTAISQLRANLTADLDRVTLNGFRLSPAVGGRIVAQGDAEIGQWTRPLIESLPENFRDRPRLANPSESNDLNLDLRLDLPSDALVAPYLPLPNTVSLGQLLARVNVSGSLTNPQADVSWSTADVLAADLGAVSSQGNARFANNRLNLEQAEITAGGGDITLTGNADLLTQTWDLDVASSPLNLSPFLPLTAQLTELTAQLSGRLDDLSPLGVRGTLALGLSLADGVAQLQGNLNQGEVDVEAIASGLSARGLNLELPLAVSLSSGQARLRSSLASLMDAALTRDLSGIRLDAEGRLAIADGTAQVQAQVVNGQVESDFSAANVALNPYLPNFPATVGLISAAGTARLSLANLLGVLDTADLTRLDPQITTEAQLALNQGSGTVLAEVAGGQWQLTTDANLPIDDAFVQELIGDRLVTSPRFPATLLAQANLSGPLNPLLQLGAVPIPAQVNRLTANIDGDLLQAQGDVLLSNLRQSPDLAANLTLDANYDSQRLPLTLLLADVAVGENLKRPSQVNIDGSVAFSGQFQGRNLLSNPLADGNLTLAGGVELRNFAVNEVAFDPLMAGTVQIETGGTLALALQGPGTQGDRLAVALEACQQGSRCLAPYLPRDLTIRKQVDGEVLFAVEGFRQGDRFGIDLDNFNVALLNLFPGQPLGITGPLQGQVTGEIVSDLFTLQTQGRVRVANPGLGYLRAEAIAAEFGYDGQETVIRNGVLQLQDSRFVLNAAAQLDLLGVVQGRIPLTAWPQTPVQGQLTVESGTVGDLLTTVAWYEIEDLLRRGLASPSLDPQDLTATGVGIPKQPLLDQLALFESIRNQVAERVTPTGEPQPPQVAEIEGTYTAAVTLGGTLGNPNLTADLAASDWVWYTQPPTPLAPGEPRPRLTLDDLRVRASFADNLLTIEQAQIQAEGGEASLVGRVSATQLEGGFEVVDVPLSLLQQFIRLPVTVAGDLQLQGRFGGTLQEPSLLGEVAVESPQLNDRPLESFLGNFSYDGDRVEFATLAPSWSQLQVSVPFPLTALTPETAFAQGRLALDTPAFELLEALSEGQVVWLGGEGQVDVAARVDLLALTSGEIERILQSFEVEGAIALDQAQVEAAAFPEAQTQVDGVIRFNEEQLDVEGLLAQVADGSFRLAGTLPLLQPNPDLERPLTLRVDQGAIALAGLYRGQLDGAITVAGTALTPVIGGGIELSQGRVSVPGGELAAGGGILESSGTNSTATNSTATNSTATNSTTTTSPFITPVLDGFRVSLGEDLRIVNPVPSFNAQVMGDVTVNGVIDGDLGNLEPQGTIRVEEGQLNVLSSVFFVTPGRPQTVTFLPEEGLLNPQLDLQVSTLVSEQRRNPMADRDRNSNEVPDTTILPLRQSRQLLVNITIDAMTEDVLDAILADSADSSQQVTVQGFESNQALLDTVQLSSIPNRSENELVSLLGGQVVTTIDEIGQLRGTEFFEYALVRFVLEPELTRLLVDIDRVANQAGAAIGLDRLSVFPIGQIEAIYELNERSLLGLTYDYGLSGFLLQGGQTESGTPGFESIELRYELRF
ncbi:MAG: hypothetical protein HLUCCO16_20230 [Phormidium sp. OSCR]|nr:MAG: hypothetical protein HLUCCO16_20230 [Phormidium sp. OSCR]